MTSRQDLITEIESFCRDTGMAPTTFGKQALNDGRFLERLKAGKNIGLNTIDKVMVYIAVETARRRDPAAHPQGAPA